MRILFVVHGMGVHSGDWSATPIAKLKETAARYPATQGMFDDGRVTIEPVSYDDQFALHLQHWDGSVDGLDQFARENAVAIPGVLAWLRGASETEKNFFWSHVVDVVLYRFFQLVTAPVRLAVMQKIAGVVTKAKSDGSAVEASIMAHSLGTSVTHDALAYLGTTPLNGSDAFLTRNFRLQNLFMVANVGRILETAEKTYESCVHPDSVRPDTAYCARYFNFRHTLDPFPVLRAFKPVGWGAGFRPYETLDHLHDFNVHGWEHYLDHPAVHVRVFNGLLGYTITDDERDAAIAAYPRAPLEDRCMQTVAAAETRFRQLIALLQTSDDPVQLVIAGTQFLAAAKEASDACTT